MLHFPIKSAISPRKKSLNKNARLMLTDHCTDAIARVSVSKVTTVKALFATTLATSSTYDHVCL